jgi:transcriptional regulator GlxA family with amidase domain
MASKIAQAIRAQEEKNKRDEQFTRLETKVEALTQQVTELVELLKAQQLDEQESTKGKSAK